MYDIDYIKWKNWESGFGGLSAAELTYFNDELSELVMNKHGAISVLEYGYGNGSFLTFCKNKNWNVVGVEKNSLLVSIGSKLGFKCFSLEEHVVIDNSYEIIAAFDVLEHLDKDELLQFLVSVKAQLKQNGVFIARFPNGDSPFSLFNQNGDITHKTSIGTGLIRKMAFDLDFKIECIRGERRPIFGVGLHRGLNRIVANLIKNIFNSILKFIFCPGKDFNFMATNLVIVLKK